MSAMPMVSLVSLAVSVRCFSGSSAHSVSGVLVVCSYICEVLWCHSAHLVSLVSLAEFMSCFSDPSAHSASGVLGVCMCI